MCLRRRSSNIDLNICLFLLWFGYRFGGLRYRILLLFGSFVNTFIISTVLVFIFRALFIGLLLFYVLRGRLCLFRLRLRFFKLEDLDGLCGFSSLLIPPLRFTLMDLRLVILRNLNLDLLLIRAPRVQAGDEVLGKIFEELSFNVRFLIEDLVFEESPDFRNHIRRDLLRTSDLKVKMLGIAIVPLKNDSGVTL